MYVKLTNLCFGYNSGEQPIIRDLELQVEHGQIVALLGESGSGKSTILRLIAGLETPTSGTICVGDRYLCNEKTYLLPEQRNVGLVFQDYALFPHMTVAQNIQFGMKRISRQQKKDSLQELLQLIGMEELANRYPHELSGGQQQRVALARALAPKPSLLLMDEPFSNLDAHLREKIREELHTILKQTGITCLFVTHDEADAKAIADEIVVVENGTCRKAELEEVRQ